MLRAEFGMLTSFKAVPLKVFATVLISAEFMPVVSEGTEVFASTIVNYLDAKFLLAYEIETLARGIDVVALFNEDKTSAANYANVIDPSVILFCLVSIKTSDYVLVQ